MYSEVNTAIVNGIDSQIVRVETDISDGMPMFSMVGVLSSEVKEAKERVRTSLKNKGISLPVKRITINISPASIKKSGTGLDLPIAVSVIGAMGVIDSERLKGCVLIGELGLSGSIHGVNGILPMVLAAASEGIDCCIVPRENVSEAVLVPDIKVVGVSQIEEVISYLNGGDIDTSIAYEDEECYEEESIDFKDINGVPLLRRASEIAASGLHNLLMIGPPGSGKTMISKAIPSILPLMDKREQMELTKIYSVCGMFGKRKKLMEKRPFRSPHHTISDAGLVGGGTIPKPGEISLAHRGVLFLDELLEFRRSTIELLRQPLEEKSIHIVRANGDVVFPADFMLVTAMNPCPCGYYPNLNKCTCTERQIRAYLSKLSQPLLDRIDICVDVPSISYKELSTKMKNESSSDIRKRVNRVHEISQKRYKNEGFSFNAAIPSSLIEKYCQLGKEENKFVEDMYDRFNMTARSYHKILRVARTIADLDEKENIELRHLREAVCYRLVDKAGVYG